MSGTAKKSDPKLWDKVKEEVTASGKGGKPGQWSARKAQMATSEYKKAGGGYAGGKAGDNHLERWTDEAWGTKSGRASGETGERYLPEKAREALSDEEYADSTAKKRADTRKGRQYSKQPKVAAETSAAARRDGKSGRSKSGRSKSGAAELTKTELMVKARAQDVKGRSTMSKAALERAVHA